jgi:hypothetical protein
MGVYLENVIITTMIGTRRASIDGLCKIYQTQTRTELRRCRSKRRSLDRCELIGKPVCWAKCVCVGGSGRAFYYTYIDRGAWSVQFCLAAEPVDGWFICRNHPICVCMCVGGLGGRDADTHSTTHKHIQS